MKGRESNRKRQAKRLRLEHQSFTAKEAIEAKSLWGSKVENPRQNLSCWPHVGELPGMRPRRPMFAQVALGVVVPFFMATIAMALGGFHQPLQRVTMSMQRWLFCCSFVSLVIPSTILLAFQPNTDAALNATSSLLLWPSHFMRIAADPHTPKSGVALVVGMSVVANVLAYLMIGLVVCVTNRVPLFEEQAASRRSVVRDIHYAALFF